MKRKKWTEGEEQTLLHAYSSSTTPTSSSSKPKLLVPITRQKRFQPIADRVNSLHHLSDPSSYPFLWSWRDIAIKIHNMRHQYLNVKHKILNTTYSDPNSNSSSNWDHALDLWPNFLRYKEVFGDIDLDPSKNLNLSADEIDEIDSDELEAEEEHCRKRRKKGWRERLRREERREQEDMEWIEKVVAMQVEHEKQAMQMHADACQAQLHILGILVRILCQFLGPGSGGGNGSVLPGQDVENLRHQRGEVEEEEEEETAEGLVGDENGKNDGHSGTGGYS